MIENILLHQRLNTSSLKSFSIFKLFGSKDISINFEQETLILIAENGTGKTTILNILYYLLSCKFSKLSYIEFESVSIEFKSGEMLTLTKDDLKNTFTLYQNEVISKVIKLLPRTEREVLSPYLEQDLTKVNSSTREVFIRLLTNIRMKYDYRMPVIYIDEIKNLIKEIQSSEFDSFQNSENLLEDKIETIQSNLHEQILYFPTYRRIEEDLRNLGYSGINIDDIEKSDERLIQFGMHDVISKFNKLKSDIKNSIVDSFSRLSGEMLTQLVENKDITNEIKTSIKPDILKIILSRVGEKNISKNDRDKIESLVKTDAIYSGEYNQLIYFLSKLISVYEEQKDKDESIKKFIGICNQYLKNKQIIYDETLVDIYILETKTNNRIDIKNLSSGEKQIISIFSKIYLDYTEDFILLFDEPELSLSIDWQKMLLPNILNSGKCKLLLAVTHSPYIFDNELDLNAYDLDTFIREE